jgi:P4 family phage/plasmid primase-like protien
MSETRPTKNTTEAKLSNISDFSHLQFAELYHKMNKDKYIFSNKSGWYSYNKFNILESYGKNEPISLLNDVILYLTKYIKDEMMILPLTIEDYKKVHTELFNAYKKVSTTSFSKGILPLLNMFYNDDELDDKIDGKNELFAFKNKVFDIKLNEFRDIEKNDYILRNTGYNAPNQIKDFTLIDELLFSIFEDKEICDYFLMTTAMSLFTNRFEKLYILTGNGRNGKGVLSTLISRSLGKYYLTGSNDLLTIKDELKNETLSKAKGIKYLAISEPAEDNNNETKFNLSMVKKLTGRDVISTRALYGNSFEYIPQFTMFVSCNKQPKVDETNEAIRNRFRFIHFPFTFVDNPKKEFERQLNVNLKDLIEKDNEYRDVLINYLLYLVSQDYDIEKIKEPLKCKEFTNLYFENNNDVGNFLEKHFTITNDHKDRYRPTELYDLYRQDGDFPQISTVKFADGLKNNNINKTKITGSLYYTGLKRKTLVENVEENPLDDI